MKPKNFERKLSLGKKTVANLDDGLMHSIYGGGNKSETLCISICVVPPGGTCEGSTCLRTC